MGALLGLPGAVFCCCFVTSTQLCIPCRDLTHVCGCRYNTFTLDDAEKQMSNPRLAFSANLNRLKKYADQGACAFISIQTIMQNQLSFRQPACSLPDRIILV